MSNIHVNIYKDEAFESRISLKEVQPDVYKLEHPSDESDRIFHMIDGNINDVVLYALMHLSNQKGK